MQMNSSGNLTFLYINFTHTLSSLFILPTVDELIKQQQQQRRVKELIITRENFRAAAAA
jgi:hypothetical protein